MHNWLIDMKYFLSMCLNLKLQLISQLNISSDRFKFNTCEVTPFKSL